MAKTDADPESDEGFGQRPLMIRGVTQLLFSYLPGKVVDWEDGVAIVQLRYVRLATAWADNRAELVLREVADYLDAWKRPGGGQVDPKFPDPRTPRSRFTVGEPVSISAAPLEGALICRTCSRLVFRTSRQLAAAARKGIECPTCKKSTLRQFGQVFVHGCGELAPVTEFLPWMKKDDTGVFRNSGLPLRCRQCGPNQVVEIPGRTERARDTKVICRTCRNVIRERLVAHCPECIKAYVGTAGRDKEERDTNTAIARVTMRLANSRANDAYYAHTLSLLRLDRPRIVAQPDDEIRLLTGLLPKDRRPDTGASGAVNLLEQLVKRLREATACGDFREVERLQQEIASVAMNRRSSEAEEAPESPLNASAPDVVKTIDEALAFRTTVTSRDSELFVAKGEGATGLLGPKIRKCREALGLRQVALVDDLPIIAAAFGYTRRSFEPTYDEETLGASKLPTRIRPFYALDRKAALRLNRLDFEGTVPILAKEGEHEGIFLSLDPDRVAAWLDRNGVAKAAGSGSVIEFILGGLEPVDRYYDQIWKLPLRRMVFGLVHSLSHAAMRVVSRLAGLERTSLSEYVFLPLLGTVVYANGSTTKLGGMETVVRDRLLEFVEGLQEEGMACLYDPDCLDRKGACHGCLHSPEISCRMFNHGLSRAFLRGGHRPWVDPAKDENLVGYWE